MQRTGRCADVTRKQARGLGPITQNYFNLGRPYPVENFFARGFSISLSTLCEVWWVRIKVSRARDRHSNHNPNSEFTLLP